MSGLYNQWSTITLIIKFDKDKDLIFSGFYMIKFFKSIDYLFLELNKICIYLGPVRWLTSLLKIHN